MRRLARLVIAAAALAACSSEPTTASLVEGGEVAATRVPGGVRIVNGTDRAIAYAAYNPNWLGLLATCADPAPSCLRLAARTSVVVPDDEVAGWDAGVPAALRKLNVRWWRVAAAPAGGYAAVDVHEIRVVE